MRLVNLSLAAFAAMSLIAGCPNTGGSGDTTNNNTSGSTSGTAKVAQFLPDALTLDVSDFDDGSDSARAAATNDYRSTVRAVFSLVTFFQGTGDDAIQVGRNIYLDLDAATQTQVAGEFEVNGTAVPYKCDFAAFDIDGDGIDDGSGNANTAPVAFRIWADTGSGYQQFMCGVIRSRGSNNVPGAGQIYAHPSAADATVSEDVQFWLDWDHTDLTHRWNQAYVSGTLSRAENVVISIGHGRIDTRITDLGTEKTGRAAATFSSHPLGVTDSQTSVHGVRGTADLLVEADIAGTDPVSIPSTCITFPAGAVATGGECDAFDTQDTNLLDIPTVGQNAFPATFPSDPTF